MFSWCITEYAEGYDCCLETSYDVELFNRVCMFSWFNNVEQGRDTFWMLRRFRDGGCSVGTSTGLNTMTWDVVCLPEKQSVTRRLFTLQSVFFHIILFLIR